MVTPLPGDGTLDRRPTDRGEATRKHILEAAAGVFAEKGYAASSLNDIIRVSGVTKGGFYFHFPSKEALAIAVLTRKKQEWAAKVMAAATRHPAAIDQLRAMPAALLDLYEADPSARVVQRLTLELSEDPRLAPDMATLFDLWLDLTASVMGRAQQEGTLRDDVDVRAAAAGAVAAFLGFEQISAVVSAGADLRRRVEQFADLYLILLRPLPAGPPASGEQTARPARPA
jgi:AcrR family transcriptional regulator